VIEEDSCSLVSHAPTTTVQCCGSIINSQPLVNCVPENYAPSKIRVSALRCLGHNPTF